MEERYVKTIQEAKGKFLKFRQDEVVLPGGRHTVRDMVLHPGAVAILALTGEGELIMVRQYRYPIGCTTLEIPAGKLEQGEAPLETAQRELEEETGFKAHRWEKLTAFFTAPGFANEVIHLYLAGELEETKSNPDPDEIIDFEKIPLHSVYDLVKKGEITDAKSIIGILWLTDRKYSG